jgi:hypothetical protein
MARLGGEPAVGARQPGPCAANAMSGFGDITATTAVARLIVTGQMIICEPG